MTRKDFDALAKIVRTAVNRPDELQHWFANELAKFCVSQNKRFDHVRFFEACGVPNLW